MNVSRAGGLSTCAQAGHASKSAGLLVTAGQGTWVNWLSQPWVARLLWAVALVGVLLGGYRAYESRHTSGDYSQAVGGFFDFHHGAYFPTKSFLDGVSPYGRDYVANYPLDTPVMYFSPSLFVLYSPIALLPLPVADGVCFVLIVALTLLVSRLTAHAVHAPAIAPLVACLLVFSRGGHSTLFTGYFTMDLVLGTILAFEFAHRRPWLAAVGLLLTACKPSYLLPLLVLLLVRGNYRAAVRGALLSAAVTAVGVGWLVVNVGVDGLLQSFAESRIYDPIQTNCLPVNTWTRIDLYAVVCKWIVRAPGIVEQLAVMGVLLVVPVMVLARLRREGDSDGAATCSGAVAALALLVSIHHQYYDLLVLAPAIAGLLLARPIGVWQGIPKPQRLAIAALALIPSFNPLSVDLVLSRLNLDPMSTPHRLLTSVNALLLAFALLILLLAIGMRRPSRMQDKTARCNDPHTDVPANAWTLTNSGQTPQDDQPATPAMPLQESR